MNTQPIRPPDTKNGMGDIYTPLEPLSDYDDLAGEEDLDEDPDLNTPEANVEGNPAERPEQPALDGDISEQTPGHHEADRDFQYDEQDVEPN